MRELDTEAPVVWPAWCYQSGFPAAQFSPDQSIFGEITSESSPQTASSPSLQISPHGASVNGSLSNSENHKNARAKRKPIHNTLQYSVDKMLNERNKQIENNNKNFLHNNNNNYNGNLVINNNSVPPMTAVSPFGDKLIKSSSDSNMNFIKNGQLSPATAQKLSQITSLSKLSNGINNGNKTNGNGPVKTERLSPPLVNDLSIYRPRSVTPQSHNHIGTVTPPQTAQPNNLMSNPNINSLLSASTTHLGNGNNGGNTQRPELPPLNYSDMMRTLAAKYNNNNNNNSNNNSNDLSTPKNTFMDSRIKSSRDTSTSLDKKPSSPPQISSNQNLLTSLFSSLQFNQNNIFNPMLDMGSTRALVLLARAAQEAEMQKLIKDADKPRKLPNLNNFPSTSTQMPNLGSFNNFNPFPALSNLQALHQLSTRSPPAPPVGSQVPSASSTTTTTTNIPYKSPINDNNPTMGVSPLDLSSSSTPPLAKRIKLSPTTTEAQRQQQATSPNVTTTNNQLTTSTSGFSTSSSSSSSTTSNNSEQTATTQSTRKCQMKIDEINAWNVDEVCSFVESIAICVEYVKNFREQSIDGEGLMMLTEEHLINILGMKLGPALKLRSKLLKRLNQPCNCTSCNSLNITSNVGDENLIDSKSFLKMTIPRELSGSADSVKF